MLIETKNCNRIKCGRCHSEYFPEEDNKSCPVCKYGQVQEDFMKLSSVKKQILKD